MLKETPLFQSGHQVVDRIDMIRRPGNRANSFQNHALGLAACKQKAQRARAKGLDETSKRPVTFAPANAMKIAQEIASSPCQMTRCLAAPVLRARSTHKNT